MAEALISPLIRRLDRRRVKMPELFKKEIDGVINELTMMVDFLRDKKLGEGSRLNYLISDVAGVVQDTLKFYSLQYWLKDWSNFKRNIDELRSWLEEAKLRLLQFASDGAEMRSENVGVEGYGEEEEEVAVGLEEDVELLFREAIFNEEMDLQTHLITGMVGIGKTTLARKVYNHAAIIDRFKRRAWVHVSTDFTYKEILMKLIVQVIESEELKRDSLLEKMERADNESLQQMLYQHLQGMPYFIVVDNLPKTMSLTSILKGLPRYGKGSKLLLTSRSHDVNTLTTFTHKMKALDSGKSWQLFLQKTLSTIDHEFPKHLEKKAKEMLKKCDGLPLAIKDVGTQLAEKRRSGSEWDQLLESIDFSATLESMESCYDELDPHLKSCFLQLASFKEFATMRAEKLKQIFGAGGMLSGSPTISYLVDLVHASMIEVNDDRYFTKSYRINAVLHRLSIKKAEEEIGFEILNHTNGNNNRPSHSPCRHRVIKCSREKFNYSTDQDNHLVSLYFQGGGCFDASPSYWESFELLRILDWEDFGLEIVPESIGTLLELRYLGLRNNHIKELPLSLGCLKKLEVLDIALNFMVELPDIIWEMDSLHHLYMSDVICLRPLKIYALQNLETLTYISVDNWTYELSGLQMQSLRKLGVEEVDGNSDISKLFASLGELRSLRHLIIRGCLFRSMPSLDQLGVLNGLEKLELDGVLAKLPDSFPPNIISLKLVNSCLDEDPMPVLEKLPHLTYLTLRNTYTGVQMVFSHPFRLLILCMEQLWNLRSLRVELFSLPLLKTLEIKNCPYLETLPEIGWITSLRKLKMVTTKNIATMIRKSDLISGIKYVDIKP